MVAFFPGWGEKKILARFPERASACSAVLKILAILAVFGSSTSAGSRWP